MRSHHNTTHEGGARLARFEGQAKSQEEQVLEFFGTHSGSTYTRSELHLQIMQRAPVSSITRALANLKKKNKIERTTEKRDGNYGRPQYCWRLADAQRQPDLFSGGSNANPN